MGSGYFPFLKKNQDSVHAPYVVLLLNDLLYAHMPSLCSIMLLLFVVFLSCPIAFDAMLIFK